VPIAAMAKALKEFKGVGRRFERYGEINAKAGGTFTLVDDYGHHPVEMQAVISAARSAFPNRRLVMAFQPHRYTRTRDCFEDFVKVLSSADVVLLTEVYSAGEAPIVAADSRSLIRAIRINGKVEPHFFETTDELPAAILDVALADDVVIVMGAGSIGQVAQKTKNMSA
jgi:UDP-N-acetylmuramate--alanine ligase